MSSDAVRVVVKAPNQRIEDQQIEVQLKWSVRDFKERLSVVYPSQPAVSDQRLIYAGHLLKDDQVLRDVFQPIISGENVILHLVCAQKLGVETSEKTKQQKGESSSSSSGASNGPTTSRNNSSSNMSDINTPRVLQQNIGVNAQMAYPMNYQMLMMNGGMAGVPLMPMFWTPEQMAHMQQMYAQFLAQYPNVVLNNGGVPQVPMPHFPSGPQVPHVPPPVPDDVPEARAAAEPRVEAAAPDFDANNPDADEEGNRDWLDLFYFFSRVVVLFSIVYFYSSMTRLFLVLGFALMMYLYQAGFIFNQRPERRAVRPAAPAAPVDNDDPVEDEGHYGRRMQQMMDNNIGRGQNVPPNLTPATEQLSGLRLFWVIVSSLFTSLIPENAPANFN